MDAMAFGMGCCCLQVTFQARDVSESRHLYDQLAVLSPILMALTAATPIARGVLLDTDARWDLIAASVDCRTPAERGDADTAATGATYDDRMAGGGRRRLPKSRYASISCYIADCNARRATKRAGGEDGVARAMSNESDCGGCSDHAKTAATPSTTTSRRRTTRRPTHSSSPAASTPRSRATSPTSSCATCSSSSRPRRRRRRDADRPLRAAEHRWQTVRWSRRRRSRRVPAGARFRSMEVQMTDFENAVFTVFAVLASRVICTTTSTCCSPLQGG